jgi:hypothetical protein
MIKYQFKQRALPFSLIISEDPGGQKKQSLEKSEQRFKCYSDKAKRERNQPDKRPQDQCEQGKRPAEYKQDEPADYGKK